MPPTLNICAVERGRAPSCLPRRARLPQIAFFDVVIQPPNPLHVGQHVRVHDLTETEDLTGGRADGRGQTWYTSKPADVEGKIIGIRVMELAVTEFILLNEVKQSLVEHAYLTVQHVQGVTVALSLWHRITRTLSLPILAHTQHVPIEHDAVVIQAVEPE
ncbi:uncharacterized protein TRAVEDRAFT_42817 [Trametes versicolor FP-101664 SS1]|uniref:uncharacterized protein n=1 Tax=Trametes versicolor (strain FP-101664) TaxID=717944 RepID=UPI00046243EB|nr:uncharacterized protein TRAVEDRAFT_42817 [Trametes versicolor FP-101664 SS1]EIW62454.1 hypothetical protein TRAVEDRAFT_42817 [Trametes versicolor FP-101664 SS1]